MGQFALRLNLFGFQLKRLTLFRTKKLEINPLRAPVGTVLPRNPVKQERSPATFRRGAPIRCKNSMSRVACETLVG